MHILAQASTRKTEFHNIKMLQMRVLVITLFVFQCLSTLGSSQSYDFFYLVQQWPASYCDTTNRYCCYPNTGKPAEDFIIRGLWPEFVTGEWPQYCNSNSSLDMPLISDLIDGLQTHWPSLDCPPSDGTDLWREQWKRYGTCTFLDQHTYFQAALDLRAQSNLLHLLKNAGIYPGNSYSVESIKTAIEGGVGYEPYIKCNTDVAGNTQLYEVYLCVDISASRFIECPIFPTKKCTSPNIEFPSFAQSESVRVVRPELRMVTSN